jgi:DNA repair protein RadA/Sms
LSASRKRIVFTCEACGHESPKWFGLCPRCREYNTCVEASGPQPAFRTAATSSLLLSDLPEDDLARLPIPFGEFHRVLGGGIVPGSVVLLGGDPGVGKSTLLLQTALLMAKSGLKALYVSAEESPQQVKGRAQRVGGGSAPLHLLAETRLESIEEHVRQLQPEVVIVDSIQTIGVDEVRTPPGTVGQVRICTQRLVNLAKTSDVSVFLVGHVTKEGDLAGPKTMEHLVDVVLSLEGERFSPYRILRSVKNRFGSTEEIGLFEMAEEGLREVLDPSSALLAGRSDGAPGSAVAATLDGTRPLLVEVQALTSLTPFGMPRRNATGIDYNRLLMLLAVLTKRLDLPLATHDVFVNVVGGLKVEEPAADLAVALAVTSSLRNKPVRTGVVATGEIGLTGEVRSVGSLGKRLGEAARLGFQTALVPPSKQGYGGMPPNLEVAPVGTLAEAVRIALG